MNKRKKIIASVALVGVLLAVYFGIEHFMYVTTDNAQIEAHTVMLAPKVPGYITKVNVVEGQRVKAGEVMVEIDERDFQNALKQFRGEMASMEAKKRDAERNFKRISELYEKEVVSQQQYDQSSANLNELRSKFEAAEAQVSQAELNIENTKIRAPSNGFIAKKSAEVGQLAAIGVPVLGFVDAEERWVIANFKETELSGIRIGSEVDVTVDAISGKDFHGKVVSLSAATGATFTLLPPDNATGNFTKVVQRVPVKIVLEKLSPEEIESLRAGLSAFVKVHKH